MHGAVLTKLRTEWLLLALYANVTVLMIYGYTLIKLRILTISMMFKSDSIQVIISDQVCRFYHGSVYNLYSVSITRGVYHMGVALGEQSPTFVKWGCGGIEGWSFQFQFSTRHMIP